MQYLCWLTKRQRILIVMTFKISWSYDGQSVYQDQVVQYSLSNNPKLPTQSATLLLLPLTSEQSSIVEKISDETKMSLSITDILMK